MKRSKVNLIVKKGDRGFSSLFSGERISKASLRIDTLGDLDELGAVLGIARFHAKHKNVKDDILELQRDLFVAGSELATTKKMLKSLPKRVDQSFVDEFEARVKRLHAITDIHEGFIIPGNVLSAAYINQARTLTRRCERKIVELFQKKEMTNKELLRWFNRLSVYLFLLARCEEKNPVFVKE